MLANGEALIWLELADAATSELFGKEYPIGNVGIKALLEA